MFDSFGRSIDYLRISVTDRCPMRCIYCMPQEGVNWIPHKEILSFEEFLTLVEIFTGLGVKKVKITGGEPLTRRGLVPFIEKLAKIKGIDRVSMTTNAVPLNKNDGSIGALLKSGLSSINISLDSLNPDTFKKISSITQFDDVVENLHIFLQESPAHGVKIKINCVPIDGINNNDLIPVARLAEKNDLDVRFIELMPTSFNPALRPVPEAEIFDLFESEFGVLRPCPETLGAGPAVYYSIEGFKGKIGFISSLSHKFCANCNRLRLTSTGLLKPCLAHEIALDLKALLRGGAPQAEIVREIEKIVLQKPAGHEFLNDNINNNKFMNRIGG